MMSVKQRDVSKVRTQGGLVLTPVCQNPQSMGATPIEKE